MVLTTNIIKKIAVACIVLLNTSTLWAQRVQTTDEEYYKSLEKSASAYKDAGKFLLADSVYNEIIPLSKQIYGDSGLEYAKVLSNLGKVRIEQQLFTDVEDMLKTALEIKEQVAGKNSMEYAETLNVLGTYYTFTGNLEFAESALLEASEIQLALKGSDDLSYVISLMDLGTLKLMARKFSEAELYYKQSISLGCKDSEPLSFMALVPLSTLYAKMGRYSEAKIYVEQYIAAIEGKYPKEHPYHIAALVNLGGCQLILDEYDKAEQTLLESLKLCVAAFGEKHDYYINTLSSLSTLYTKTGQYEKAELIVEKFLLISKVLYGQNHLKVVNGLNNLAALYLKTGNYAKAIQTVTEAVETTNQTIGQNSIEYVSLSNVLANIYISQEEYEKAYPLLLQADSLLATIEGGHVELELALINNLNFVLFKINIVDDDILEKKLIDVIDKKKKYISENNNSYYLSLNNLASFYDEKSKHLQAREVFDSLLTQVERNVGKESPLYHNILLNSSINYELMDSIGQAKHSFELFLELSKERVSHNFAFMPENERELYWKTLNNNIKRCQSFADRYKSKDPTLAHLAYDCELFSKNLLLSSSQAVRQSILSSNDEQLIADWSSLTELRNNSQSNTDTIRSLEKRLMINSKEYQRQQKSLLTTWKDIASSLADDEAAIEFITYEAPDSTGVTERIYTALILRRNGLQAELVMLTQCKESSLKQAIGSSGYDFEKLYPLVWDPMDNILNGVKKVYVSPIGLLNTIPFAAIKNKGEYISDKYTIHNLLSSKDIISLKNDSTQPSNKNALLFGGADFGLSTADLGQPDDMSDDKVLRSLLTEFQEERGQGFDYLPGSKQEVEKISKILSKQNWEVSAFVDKNATETHLKLNLSQNSPSLLHISTHGYYFPLVKELFFNNRMSESNKFYRQSENPLMRCGLLFSGANSTWNGQEQSINLDDGILTAYEISNLNLSNADLVVLSACETGLGDMDYSEGIYGLQRAFRLAGAKSMIVSLWKVSDKDALEFMVEFYQQWALIKDKKEAFDKAQGKMRKKYDEVKKWAGFILIE